MIKSTSGKRFCDWETMAVVMSTVTTYTVKTNSWCVLHDVQLLARLSHIVRLWQQLLQLT